MTCGPSLGVCFPFLRPFGYVFKKAHSRLTTISPSSFETPDFEWDYQPVRYQHLYNPGGDEDEVQILFQNPRLRLRTAAPIRRNEITVT